MEVEELSKERRESLEMALDLDGLSSALFDARSVVEMFKRKRRSVEVALLEENKRLKIDLENLRKVYAVYRTEVCQIQVNHVTERRALRNQKLEFECLQKRVQDDGMRRDRESLEEAVARSAEFAQTQRDFDNDREMWWLEIGKSEQKRFDAENELVSTRQEKTRLHAFLQTMVLEYTGLQTDLQQLTEDKGKLELTHQSELKQAYLDHQKSNRELQHIAAAKRIVERELVEMREDRNRLTVALETVQRNLTEEKEKKLCGICLESPKDAICLPCVHADFCFRCLEKHRTQSRTCPTCRAVLSGVLRSDIGTFVCDQLTRFGIWKTCMEGELVHACVCSPR